MMTDIIQHITYSHADGDCTNAMENIGIVGIFPPNNVQANQVSMCDWICA